jgi:hypothetical protein
MSQRKKERLLKGILEGCKVETVDPFQCQCHRFWVVAVGSRVVGDRTADDEVTYPEIDLELKAGPDVAKSFRHKDGTPYPREARAEPLATAGCFQSAHGRKWLGAGVPARLL